jgi:uncharacterized protein DUF6547
MADREVPEDPAEVYKWIIDDCVNFAKDVRAERIRSGIPYSPNDPSAPEELLLKSLSPAHRKTLAQMLDESRSGGVHDLLARLTWWIDCHGLRLTYRGQPVPVDFSGMGLHGDYIGRLDQEEKWKWPDEPPAPLPPWNSHSG